MKRHGLSVCILFCLWLPGQSQQSRQQPDSIKLSNINMRDVCILPDPASKTYYMVGAGRQNSVRAYTSTDLATWYGPEIIFTAPDSLWGDIEIFGIWAPELHAYRDKYYLFLTFNTRNAFSEQWRKWRPRVTRGSQVLVADAPIGPYTAFNSHATLPVDMMTLDGTLWVEDGVPYMVYCHEWVQIKDGTIEYIQLTEDPWRADALMQWQRCSMEQTIVTIPLLCHGRTLSLHQHIRQAIHDLEQFQ
jgi:hypothetical protein